jgi:protein phosphatase 1G
VPIKVPDSEDSKGEENTDDLSPKSKDSNDSDASDNSDNSDNSETGGGPDHTNKSKQTKDNEPISSDEAIRMISELLEGARKYRSAKNGAATGAKSDIPVADSKEQRVGEESGSHTADKSDSSTSSSKKKPVFSSDSDSKKEGVANVGTTPSSFMDDEDEEGNLADVESSGSSGKGAESKLTSDFKEQVSLFPAAGRGDSKKDMMEKKISAEEDLSPVTSASSNSNDSADAKDSAATPIVRDPSKKDLDNSNDSVASGSDSNEEDLSPPKLADAKAVPLSTTPPAPASIMAANGTMMCNLKDHRVLAGCTAIVALLVGNKKLFVANAGDSRAVMMRNGLAVALSEDHKPQQERELNRIRSAGGYVNMVGRVNGNLNLSR